MGAAIELAELRELMARYGRLATVVSVAEDGTPHIGSSMVDVDGDHVIIEVGQRTAGYLRSRPDLTICWMPPAGDDYQLIVGLTVSRTEPVGDLVRVHATVRQGIRHRVAGAAQDGPSCVPIRSDS